MSNLKRAFSILFDQPRPLITTRTGVPGRWKEILKQLKPKAKVMGLGVKDKNSLRAAIIQHGLVPVTESVVMGKEFNVWIEDGNPA